MGASDISAGLVQMDGLVTLVGNMVISLDLDGTLEFGDPPGPITPAIVRALQQATAAVGSASDRTARDQARLWQRFSLEPDFVVVKAQLRSIPARYPSRLLVHIGDRFADHLEAINAGALFVHVDTLSVTEWSEPDHLYRAILDRLGPLRRFDEALRPDAGDSHG